jgi:hypothetical protein
MLERIVRILSKRFLRVKSKRGMSEGLGQSICVDKRG